METLRVGIVGAGGIARHHHVPSYKRCRKVAVVAACDVSETALAEMKGLHGITRLYRDYREMLAEEQLDLISVCTSNDMHHPVTMAAIARGLDVFCEKPLALNLAQAREMAAAAEAHGTRTGVNFAHRRTPASRLAEDHRQRRARPDPPVRGHLCCRRHRLRRAPGHLAQRPRPGRLRRHGRHGLPSSTWSTGGWARTPSR